MLLLLAARTRRAAHQKPCDEEVGRTFQELAEKRMGVLCELIKRALCFGLCELMERALWERLKGASPFRTLR